MKHHLAQTPSQQGLTLGWAMTFLLALALHSLPATADSQTRTSSFEYDAQGLLIKETIEPDRANDCLQTSYSYDSFGNKTQISTASCPGASGGAVASAGTSRTAGTTYTNNGKFPSTSANALGQTESKTYDPRYGAITSLTGPNGLTTSWTYDTFGRKTRETRADGTYTTWTYLLCSQGDANCPGAIGGANSIWVAIEQSNGANAVPNAPQKRSYYDSFNRVLRSQTQGFDGAGAAPILIQDTEYDKLGRVTRKSNPYTVRTGAMDRMRPPAMVWTTYQYDALGRVTQEQSPDSDAPGGIAITAISYDGLKTTTTNPKGQSKTSVKNAQGQVAQVIDAQNNSVTYSYDAQGQLVQTNAAGSITQLSYNQRGQKTAMVDPAMGSWSYSYNAFGELVGQTDSLGKSSSIEYDVLGRMTKRVEGDLTSSWSYDKKFDGTSCGKSLGKLCEAIADNGYRRVHSYDSLGRPSSTATTLDSAATPVTVAVSYDATTGRVTSKTWPTGYQASYQYTALGYLKQVTGGGTAGFTQTSTYEVLAMNEQGQVTQYRQGGKVTTVKNYDPTTGRLKSQTATTDGQAAGNVLDQSYGYDSLGNLLTRGDTSPGVGTQESFTYDSLNRLTLATALGGALSPPQTTQVIYDARGNITYKSDVGRYWYDAARPNRLTQVTLETAPGALIPLTGTRALSYAFDDYKPGAQAINGTTLGNGNLWYTVSQDTANNRNTVRWESYTSYNMPATIEFGSVQQKTASAITTTSDRKLSFVYGPEHQRIKQTVVGGPNPGTTWYLNGEDSQGLTYEKEVRADGTTENKHYLSAGGVVFAMFTTRTGILNGKPATSTNYFHQDQLGSISAITNEQGQVIERLAYDPWGKRRQTNGLTDKLDALYGQNTDRGYTMHEHLDEVGVIHMNGRIYDPLVGRFMSADPFIQAPSNLQSYNRYAYVMNNPLAYTDPSGYWSLRSLIRTVAAIAAAVYLGPAGSGAVVSSSAVGGSVVAATITNAAIAGFAAGAISGGGIKSAMNGAFSGALFGAAGFAGGPGTAGANSMARYVAHAVAGCLSSAAASGSSSCGSGAASALFGKYATNVTESWGVGVAQGVAAAVAGGVGSVIGGGKFANGAQTAAFGYLFNAMSAAARAKLIGTGAMLGGTTGALAVSACTAGTGGVCALGAPTAIGAGAAAGGAVGAGIANLVDWVDSLVFAKTPNTGEPGSWVKNPGNGQERKFGSDGKPEIDIDRHSDHGAGTPHGHNWDRGPNGEPIRGPGVPLSPWPKE